MDYWTEEEPAEEEQGRGLWFAVREALEPRLRPIPIICIIVAATLFISGGAVLHTTPDYEVMYSKSSFQIAIPKLKKYFVFFQLELGNTGMRGIDDVCVVLSAPVVKQGLVPPQIKNFGVVDRPGVRIEENSDTTAYRLGCLKRGKRVRVDLTVWYDIGQEPHTWDQIFRGIEVSQGNAVEGDPACIGLKRVLYSILMCF